MAVPARRGLSRNVSPIGSPGEPINLQCTHYSGCYHAHWIAAYGTSAMSRGMSSNHMSSSSICQPVTELDLVGKQASTLQQTRESIIKVFKVVHNQSCKHDYCNSIKHLASTYNRLFMATRAPHAVDASQPAGSANQGRHV